MIAAVEFIWDDGYVQVVEYPSMVRGLLHKGKRPIKLSVYVTVHDVKVHDVKVVEWVNECHCALESTG